MEINSPKTVPKQVRLFEVRFKTGEPLFDTVVLDETDTFDARGEKEIVIVAGGQQIVYYKDALAAVSIKLVVAEVRVDKPRGKPEPPGSVQ